MNIRYIPDGKQEPAYSMAADEALYLLHSAGSMPATLRIWGLSRSAVMLGRFSAVGKTVNVQQANGLGIPTVRRFTGGGVTYNDSRGDMGWTYVSFGDNTVEKYVEAASAIHEAMRPLGLYTKFTLSGGISIDGKKISGLAAARSGNTVLVHGTLLYNPDLAVMNRVLIPLPSVNGLDQEPADIVTSLSNLKGREMAELEVAEPLQAGFSSLGNLVSGKWSSAERALISRLEPQYRDHRWNFRM